MSEYSHAWRTVQSRREMLRCTGLGLGGLALWPLLQVDSRADSQALDDRQVTALAPRPPHFAPRARHVIHIFLNGGCSHIDTFDPKPSLQRYAGREIPIMLATERKTGAALPSPFKFQRYGQSGIEVSEIFANVGSVIDEFTVLRSLHADVPNHEPSLLLMNCGEARLVRPSLARGRPTAWEPRIRICRRSWPCALGDIPYRSPKTGRLDSCPASTKVPTSIRSMRTWND